VTDSLGVEATARHSNRPDGHIRRVFQARGAACSRSRTEVSFAAGKAQGNADGSKAAHPMKMCDCRSSVFSGSEPGLSGLRLKGSGKTILSWDVRICSGFIYSLSPPCSDDSARLTNPETLLESTPAMISKRFAFSRATISANDGLLSDSGDRPHSITRKTNAGTAVGKGGPPRAPTGSATNRDFKKKGRKRGSRPPSAPLSPEKGSTSPFSRRIGLKSAI
jgi:hypothetical protein